MCWISYVFIFYNISLALIIGGDIFHVYTFLVGISEWKIETLLQNQRWSYMEPMATP